MKLAFSQAINKDAGIRQLLTGFRSIGYHGLQLKGSQYEKYLDEPKRFIDDWGTGGTASAVIAGGTLDEANRDKLRRLFRFGQAVGTERVIFCHGVPRENLTDDDLRRFAGILSEVGKESRGYGLKLSLHNHFNNPVMRRKDFEVFFGAVKDDLVGLTLDTAHLVKSGVDDIAEVIRSFRHVIDNFHLKDFAEGKWQVLGEGTIDFVPVFAAIRDIGYDGWISTDEESGAETLPAMKLCYDFMIRGLKQP